VQEQEVGGGEAAAQRASSEPVVKHGNITEVGSRFWIARQLNFCGLKYFELLFTSALFSFLALGRGGCDDGAQSQLQRRQRRHSNNSLPCRVGVALAAAAASWRVSGCSGVRFNSRIVGGHGFSSINDII
jgi:hypothetical protein